MNEQFTLTKVTVKNDLCLQLKFSDGYTGELDLKPMIMRYKALKSLAQPKLFIMLATTISCSTHTN